MYLCEWMSYRRKEQGLEKGMDTKKMTKSENSRTVIEKITSQTAKKLFEFV